LTLKKHAYLEKYFHATYIAKMEHYLKDEVESYAVNKGASAPLESTRLALNAKRGFEKYARVFEDSEFNTVIPLDDQDDLISFMVDTVIPSTTPIATTLARKLAVTLAPTQHFNRQGYRGVNDYEEFDNQELWSREKNNILNYIEIHIPNYMTELYINSSGKLISDYIYVFE
jgi:hypothetical protein